MAPIGHGSDVEPFKRLLAILVLICIFALAIPDKRERTTCPLGQTCTWDGCVPESSVPKVTTPSPAPADDQPHELVLRHHAGDNAAQAVGVPKGRSARVLYGEPAALLLHLSVRSCRPGSTQSKPSWLLVCQKRAWPGRIGRLAVSLVAGLRAVAVVLVDVSHVDGLC